MSNMKNQGAEDSWHAAWGSPLRFASIFLSVGVFLLFIWISRSIFVGLEKAVKNMLTLMRNYRG